MEGRVSGQSPHLIFHRFSPFNCCLTVALQLGKGDYPENSHVVFCPNKQRSFEALMCLDVRTVSVKHSGSRKRRKRKEKSSAVKARGFEPESVSKKQQSLIPAFVPAVLSLSV